MVTDFKDPNQKQDRPAQANAASSAGYALSEGLGPFEQQSCVRMRRLMITRCD